MVPVQTPLTVEAPKTAPAAPSIPSLDERRWGIWKDCFSGGVFIILALLCKLLIEGSGPVHWLEQASYPWLLHWRSIQPDSRDLPIIIDISDLHYTYDKEGPRNPRPELRALLEALNRQHPRAIGLDIDFARREDSGAFVDVEDPAFLRYCVDSPVPIVVGAYRRIWEYGGSPLGAEPFDKIAGEMSIPEDKRKMSYWVKPAAANDFFPSFSAILADAARNHKLLPAARAEWEHHSWKSWILESSSELKLGDHHTAGEFLNDLSVLPHLKVFRISTPEALTAHHDLNLAGRILLIGRVDSATDKFVVPGNTTEAIAGIKLHACGVYTLLNGRLYEMRVSMRIILDLIVSGLMLGAVTAFRLHFARKRPEYEIRTEWLTRFLARCIAFLVTVTSLWLFAGWIGWLWMDFILVALMLAFHTDLEHLVTLGGRLWRTAQDSFLKHVLTKKVPATTTVGPPTPP